MSTYTTVQGDMWDLISYKLFASSRFSNRIMMLNTAYLDYYILPAGITLNIPALPSDGARSAAALPWKGAVG